MKTKYKNGIAVGHIYSREEHGILLNDIAPEALKVVNTLCDASFESFIVGGALRDLMLGRKPKDFDVVTSASPRQVHRIFKNSRIIGKRFRIVHVIFGKTIIEVSTFRSLKDHNGNNDNIFGTIEEDSQRRDFSINSLYYNPYDETILDLTGAMNDFTKRRIRSLIPLKKTFIEDPVRMIRAIKYCVTTGFKMDFRLRWAIKKNAALLSDISTSRLTEELHKILACGKCSPIFAQLKKYGLLVYILPCLSVYADFPQVYESLEALDKEINSSTKEISCGHLYFMLVRPLITKNPDVETYSQYTKDVFRQIKVLITPNTPPNSCIEEAVKEYTGKYKICNAKFVKPYKTKTKPTR